MTEFDLVLFAFVLGMAVGACMGALIWYWPRDAGD